MAYREYIGSRYVPMFGRKGESSTEWNNTAPYEPLTVVTYQGNSYTSRQYVPVGIPISNTDFWAPTGNYNAQVEAYRQEVFTFNDRINGNAAAIEANTQAIENATDLFEQEINNLVSNPDIKQMSIEVMNGVDHTITLVSDAEGNYICFDCAGVNDINVIRNFLTAKLGSSKLKAVIITHFHSDHYKGFSEVAKFCDADTDIYIQMRPTQRNDEYSDYIAGYNEVKSLAQTDGLKVPVTPANLSTVNYGDLVVKFFNTNLALADTYDVSYAQDSWDDPTYNNFQHPWSTLNNYSIVTLVKAYGASYLDTGDIEGEAQKQLAEMMEPVTVAKHPHHLWNRMGFELFYDRIQPQYWIATDHFRTEADGYIGDGRFDTTYLFRYLLYNQIDVNVVTNDNTDINCQICNNRVTEISGYFIDKDYSKIFENSPIAPQTTLQKANQILFDAIIPPSVYFDNPYQALLLSLDDMWALKTYTRGCPFFDFRIPASYETKYQIKRDCDAIFYPTFKASQEGETDGNKGNYYITLRETPTIWVDSQWRNGTHIELLYDFTMAQKPLHMRRYEHGSIPMVINGTWDNGDRISESDFDSIRYSSILTCMLPSTRRIPLVNTRNDVIAGVSGASGDYTGCAVATGGATLYAVKNDSNG